MSNAEKYYAKEYTTYWKSKIQKMRQQKKPTPLLWNNLLDNLLSSQRLGAVDHDSVWTCIFINIEIID